MSNNLKKKLLTRRKKIRIVAGLLGNSGWVLLMLGLWVLNNHIITGIGFLNICSEVVLMEFAD